MSDGKRILVVEDDRNLGFILQENLSLRGYQVQLAADGEEGLRAFRSGQFDLCLADVMMPKKNGFDVCQAVKHELGLGHIHVILLTAKGQEFDRQKGQEVGADLYMTKPFDPDALLEKARGVLGL